MENFNYFYIKEQDSPTCLWKTDSKELSKIFFHENWQFILCCINEDKEFYPILYNGCNNLSMLGFKFINLSEKGPMEMCIWVSELGYNWFSKWLVACLAPSHYWIKTDFFLIRSSFSNTSTEILSYSFKKCNYIVLLQSQCVTWYYLSYMHIHTIHRFVLFSWYGRDGLAEIPYCVSCSDQIPH